MNFGLYLEQMFDAIMVTASWLILSCRSILLALSTNLEKDYLQAKKRTFLHGF